MCVNGRYYSIGEDEDRDNREKCEMFLNVMQEQYRVITGKEIRIEQIVGHYDEE